MTGTTRPARRRRHLLRWLLPLLILLLAWPLFRMFEPVLTWSSGWQPMPGNHPPAVHRADADWTAIAAEADAGLLAAHRRLQTPALSAAIAIDGVEVWAGAVGWADVDARRPVDLDSAFRIGSSSKAINALAIGRLVDAGSLDLDRPVRDFLPELPSHYDAVTTRMAISHTAGIPDYGLCLCFPIWEHRNRRHFTGVRDALQVFVDRPLLFAPGSDFRYSSYGANVAGAVAAAVAGTSYIDMLQQAVFAPLRMSGSGADDATAVVPRRVAFYEVTENQYKLADATDNSIRYPSGGLLSTPADMLAVGNAWLGNGLLSEATLARLLTPQAIAGGRDNPQGYALGIRVSDQRKLFDDTVTTRFYSHHGTAIGSTSYFAVYPEYRLVVSMMMNMGQSSVDAIAPEATRLVELFISERLRREAADAD